MTRPGLRRLLHASTSLLVVLGQVSGWPLVRVLLTAGVPFAAVFETVRLRRPMVRARLHEIVPVYKPAEQSQPSGAFWLLVGYAVCAWYPAPAAAAGMLAGALADPLAAVVGSRWGGTRSGGGAGRDKSWVGTGVVFAVTAAIVAALGVGDPAGGVVIVSLMAGAVGAALERWPGPLDDNLLLAPGVGLAVWLAG